LENLPLFISLDLLDEVFGTNGGFGFLLLYGPVAGYFLVFHSILGIRSLFHASRNFGKTAPFRKRFDKILVISIGVPAVFFVIAGAFLNKFIETKSLEI